MPQQRPTALELPASYAELPFRHIKVSHVPESSPTPTKVILITLNRPDKNNAFTDIMREDMEHVYQLIDVDDRVKCVVLTGAGKMVSTVERFRHARSRTLKPGAQ